MAESLSLNQFGDMDGVETFGLPSKWLQQGDSLLQSRSYAEGAIRAREAVEKCGLRVERVANCVGKIYHLTEDQARSNFKRIYAEEGEGPPYLTPSEMFQFRPERRRFLSTAMPKLSEMMAEQGTIMLTRSGTTGHPVLVNKTLSDFAISDDAIRIWPNSVPIGYVYAFLASKYGQALVSKDEYGATVKHVESKHIGNLPIPLPRQRVQEEIHEQVLESYRIRDRANELLDDAEAEFHQVIGVSHFTRDDIQYLGKEVDPRAFTIASKRLQGRFDASRHVPVARSAVAKLKEGKYPLVSLDSQVQRVYVAPRFKRIYVEPEYGPPLMQGSHLPLMRIHDLKHISEEATKNIDRWIVEKRWVLVTCSGTVGRVAISTEKQDGWAVSQHILRIVPDEEEANPGFIAAFLGTPYGQHQLKSKIYGGVVDELTSEDTAKVQLPDVPIEQQRRIGEPVVSAYEMRDEANRVEDDAINRVEALIGASERGMGPNDS